jgi:hypothetical protein
MNCAGSINLIDKLGIVGDGGNEYSRAGTAQHEISAEALKTGADAWEFAGTTRTVDGHAVPITEEMAPAIQTYLDYIRSIGVLPGGKRLLEHRVGLEHIHEDISGTLDFGRLLKDRLLIADAKFGFGVVEPDMNPQLLIYAAGLYADVKAIADGVSEVELVIVQPNAPHADGHIRSWRISVSDLVRWSQEVLKPAAEATEKPNAPLTPGDHCQYCPARNQCPALQQQFFTAADDAEKAAEPAAMTEAELAEWRAKFPALVQFMAVVTAEMFARTVAGKTVPGWKLVRGRANRIWRDDAEPVLVKAFGDEAWNKTLKSPAQAEKLPGGKAVTAEHAYKPEGALTLAPESDKRPSVPAPTADAAFAGFTDATQE